MQLTSISECELASSPGSFLLSTCGRKEEMSQALFSTRKSLHGYEANCEHAVKISQVQHYHNSTIIPSGNQHTVLSTFKPTQTSQLSYYSHFAYFRPKHLTYSLKKTQFPSTN